MATTLIGSPASITTPPAGEVQLFLDSTNNNVLSYKDENGNVFEYNEGDNPIADECLCDIATKWSEDLSCSLKSGVISAGEYQIMMSRGLIVESDVVGNKKTLTIGVRDSNAEPVSLEVRQASDLETDPSITPIEAFIETTIQMVAFVFPTTVNQAVVWESMAPEIATIDANGLITIGSTGDTSISMRCSSVANPLLYKNFGLSIFA